MLCPAIFLPSQGSFPRQILTVFVESLRVLRRFIACGEMPASGSILLHTPRIIAVDIRCLLFECRDMDDEDLALLLSSPLLLRGVTLLGSGIMWLL